jgi:hypothetical protein
MKNRGRFEMLIGEFAGATIEFCYLFQDLACISYVKTIDVEKEKKDINGDIDRIQEITIRLCKLASENDLDLDPQNFNIATEKIKEALEQIKASKDLEKYIYYYEGGKHDNDLIDKIAYQLYSEFLHLYYKAVGKISSEAIFPYKTQPVLASYGEVTRNPQSAIQQSFTIFEDYLRYKIGADVSLFGEELINKAFGRDGVLVYSNVPAEQSGVRNLFSGFYATFRNPHMHRIIQVEENQSLAIISTMYLLLDIVNKSQVRSKDEQR